MINTTKYVGFLILTLLLAGYFRLHDLDSRPMHTDEAVHAVKFGKLLEEGHYRYDPFEYHGPVLNYLTLLPARISGKNNFNELNEYTLRLVPALAGLFLILIIPLFSPAIHRTTQVYIALLVFISPVMVFYSRYYIMEMLLLLFTFAFIGSVYRYLVSGKWVWTALSGIFLGLMYATKETFILSLAAMFVAVVIPGISDKKHFLNMRRYLSTLNSKQLILFPAITLLTAFLFFSSFFSHPQGIIDSVTTYTTYFQRAGQHDIHEHPWYYYLKVLGWYPGPGKMPWSELFILILFGAGITGLLLNRQRNNRLLKFIAIFSFLLFAIYSLIPYKTPWNALPFYMGMIIIAGYGIQYLLQRLTKLPGRTVLLFFLGAGFAHLIVQSWLVNFVYEAHPSNPYVYGHTSTDIYKVMDRVEKVAGVHPDGKDMYIEVISPGSDYWPLPWYMRDFSNVGWWDQVEMDNPPAPLILGSAAIEEKLMKKLYEKPPPGERYLYMPLIKEYTELRPGVEIRGYLRKDLWDLYHQKADE